MQGRVLRQSLTLNRRFIALWSPIFHHSVAQSSFAVSQHSYDPYSLELIFLLLGKNPGFQIANHAFDFISGKILLMLREALRYEF